MVVWAAIEGEGERELLESRLVLACRHKHPVKEPGDVLYTPAVDGDLAIARDMFPERETLDEILLRAVLDHRSLE